MQNFIVLGLVPGTNIQLNLTFWVSVAATLLAVPLIGWAWRYRNAVYNWVLCYRVNRVLRHTAPYQV